MVKVQLNSVDRHKYSLPNHNNRILDHVCRQWFFQKHDEPSKVGEE